MPLNLLLFGSFQASVNGDAVTNFRSDKVRALLAYLAIEAGRPHRRAFLAALFWPDHGEAAAHLNLRQSLLRLRRALTTGSDDSDFLLISRTDVQFDADGGHWVDAAVADRLFGECERHAHVDAIFCPDCVTRRRQAAALYRGPLLAGLTVRDSEGFDEWLVARQEQFHRQALEALRHLAVYHEQNAEYELARRYAQRQVALEPWSEVAHRQLMRGFALSGQRAAALAQYDICRRTLEQELGAEPDEETEALHRDIRAGGLPSRRQRHGEALSALAPAQWRVPVPLTPFIGRERELTELGARFAAPADRLLMLLGPGGIGKSRLALRAAELHQERFEHGAALISLAPVRSPDLLVAAMAGALGLSFHGAETPKQQLLNLLREREALLILDNFEAFVERADVLVEILSYAPRVTILVTSQARLNVPGERVMALSGFASPQGSGKEVPNDGVALFLSRARQALPAFSPGADERAAIAGICGLVSGVPLAIEMAASWMTTLSVTEIARELEQGGANLKRARPPTGAQPLTLQPIFDRSWQLLSPAEKYVFRKIAVFPGSFDRVAAGKVAGAEAENLARLLDRSFLLRPLPGRYEAHESLKQYGAGRLGEVPREVTDTCDRHSDYYVAFLEQRLAALRGSEQRAALRELSQEIENIRLAWAWAVQHERVESLERALEPLFHFYDIRSWFEEGARMFGNAIAPLERRVESASLQASPQRSAQRLLGKLLARKGWFAFHLGDQLQAQTLLERSVSMLRALEAGGALIFSLNYLAAVTYQLGDYAAARVLCDESLTLCNPENDRHGAAIASNIMSQIAFLQGDYHAAGAHGRAALSVEREIGNRWSMAFSLMNLGNVAFASGAYDEATNRFEESLTIRREMQDARGIAMCVGRLGDSARATGDYGKATEYYAESSSLSREIGDQRGSALARLSLGMVARATGELDQARGHFLDALSKAYTIHALPVALDALLAWSELLAANGDAEQARSIAKTVWVHPSTGKSSKDRAAALLDVAAESLSTPVQPLEQMVEALLASIG